MMAEKPPTGECRVIAGSKLSKALDSALCAEVKGAIATVAPSSSFFVEVTAMSPSRLAAQVTLDGQVLPTQNFAVMDAQLDRESIRRFAQSLGEVVRSAKR